MSEPDPDAWTETTTGRERVRMVVESLDKPATVTAIADEADVAWETANSELERMLAEDLINEYEDGGQTTYGPNHIRQFLDQILDLIEEHDRGELERRLVEYQERLEALRDQHDAESARDLRERLTEDDRTAAEMQEIRDVASTWETLEAEIRLTKHALYFYEDIVRLSGAGDDGGLLSA